MTLQGHEPGRDESHLLFLKDTRQRSGLTQRQMAKRLSVSQPRIARIEAQPIGRLRLETIIKYMDALELPYWEIAVIDCESKKCVLYSKGDAKE